MEGWGGRRNEGGLGWEKGWGVGWGGWGGELDRGEERSEEREQYVTRKDKVWEKGGGGGVGVEEVGEGRGGRVRETVRNGGRVR